MIANLRHLLPSREAADATFEKAHERAARGATFLDIVDPAWHRRISIAALWAEEGDRRTLARLHECFLSGLEMLCTAGLGDMRRLCPHHLGFVCLHTACDALREQDYAHLNEAWRREIELRWLAETSEVEAIVRQVKEAATRELGEVEA